MWWFLGGDVPGDFEIFWLFSSACEKPGFWLFFWKKYPKGTSQNYRDVNYWMTVFVTMPRSCATRWVWGKYFQGRAASGLWFDTQLVVGGSDCRLGSFMTRRQLRGKFGSWTFPVGSTSWWGACVPLMAISFFCWRNTVFETDAIPHHPLAMGFPWKDALKRVWRQGWILQDGQNSPGWKSSSGPEPNSSKGRVEGRDKDGR